MIRHGSRDSTALPLYFMKYGGSVPHPPNVSERDLKGLRAFAEDQPRALRYVVCKERAPRDTGDGIHIRPVESFFEALWAGSSIEIP
jgi:hypothetical protein